MASSVPSESLFSEAGDQLTDKRNRLDPVKVNKMSDGRYRSVPTEIAERLQETLY